mgnify:FL=1
MSEAVTGKPWQVYELIASEARELGLENLPGNDGKYTHSAYSNFVVRHQEHGIIGKADLYEDETYVILEAAEIPEYRGLEAGESSPFGDLIETRIEAAGDRDLRTSAVTEHGKTQYKYPQYGFTNTGIMPLPEPDSKPLMPMWEGDFESRDVFIAPEIEEFVESATEGLFETRFREASKPDLMERGYESRSRGPGNGPLKFHIDSGTSKPFQIAKRIDTKSRIEENYITSAILDMEDPATQAITRELYSEGYRPIRVEVPDKSIGTPSQIVMGKLHQPIEGLELTDESIDLLEKSGLNFEVEEVDEKSSEVNLLEKEAF